MVVVVVVEELDTRNSFGFLDLQNINALINAHYRGKNA
jgi:hypothetical protein